MKSSDPEGASDLEWPPPDQQSIDLEAGEFLNAAWDRASASLDGARRLRGAGFNGPAFVWAVRAAEIFTREFLLTPLFLEESDDVREAVSRARNVFGSGNWVKAYARLEEYVGPIDKMLTDTDEDAWKHWNRHASDIRGNVVHGNSDVSLDLVDWAIAYVERLFRQMVMRMIVSQRHPAGEIFMRVGEAIGRALKDDSAG